MRGRTETAGIEGVDDGAAGGHVEGLLWQEDAEMEADDPLKGAAERRS